MTLEQKLQSLLTAANAATGEAATNLTDAVGTLIAGQAPVYPDEYVTDGLYFCLDAINNAGDHHDASATSWIDTVNGVSFDLIRGDAPIIGDNFLYFYSGVLADSSALDEPEYCEFVIQLENKNGTSFIMNLTNNTMNARFIANSASKSATLCAYGGGFAPAIAGSFPVGLVTEFGGGKSVATILNGNVVKAGDRFDTFSYINAVDVIGAYRDTGSYMFKGYLCAIRFYNRTLSAMEIAQNYEHDKKRFSTEITLDNLFDALPALSDGVTKTISVDAERLAEASEGTIAIATEKGWTVA